MILHNGRWRQRTAPALGCLLVASIVSLQGGTNAASAEVACDLPATGVLTVQDLPEGSDAVECDAVGRIVSSPEGLQAMVPEVGTTLSIEEMYPDGAIVFEVTTDESGEISYASDADDSEADPAPRPAPTLPPECNQSAYNTLDRKEYGTYNVWIGDGDFPGSLTRTEFQTKVINSLENIVQAKNDCNLGDSVDATGAAAGWSDYESDMSATSCGDGSADGRDHTSVWDAGNIDGTEGKSSPVARTCAWTAPTAGIKNDLLEADVRFNITDYNWTISPNVEQCDDKYDVVSVGTHEAGHVFGMAHVSEADYPWMTMSTNSHKCNSSARTLGKGDILGLESIY